MAHSSRARGVAKLRSAFETLCSHDESFGLVRKSGGDGVFCSVSGASRNLYLVAGASSPQGTNLEQTVQHAIEDAEELCKADENPGNCAAAWDEVEELAAAVAHKKVFEKESKDPRKLSARMSLKLTSGGPTTTQTAFVPLFGNEIERSQRTKKFGSV